MSDDGLRLPIERVYGDWGIEREAMLAIIDDAPPPTTPDVLYDIAADAGVGSGTRVLDAGCRDAQHSEQLVERFGCAVVGLDYTRYPLEVARRRVDGRVPLLQGSIDSLPLRNGAVDVVWCRDMLNHVADLAGAMRECGRVLSAGGCVLVFQSFATARLTALEAEEIYLGSIPAFNMDPGNLERCTLEAGLDVERMVPLEARETGEYAEHTRANLPRIARLRRDRERIEAALGSDMYAYALSGMLWGVYLTLGKLASRIYVLRKP